MTREDEAIKALCKVTGTYEEVFSSPIVSDLLFPVHEIVAAMLAFADGEAAAMRERAAGVAKDHAEGALHLHQKASRDKDGTGMTVHGEGMRTSWAICHAIQSLPATGEVGRG